MDATVSEQRPHSPCIGVCQFDAQGLCLGCLRDVDQVMAWPGLDSDHQTGLMAGPLRQQGIDLASDAALGGGQFARADPQ